MKLRFWGVRGAFAMPGPEYLRYGGNTAAVELVAASGRRLLIDLGTGATVYAKALMETEFGQGKGELPILLSHTHLDHIQGLPFFTPFFIRGNRISILGSHPSTLPLEQVLQNQLNPHYSPLYGLENLAAGVTVQPIGPGSSLPVEGFEVTAAAVPHGTMRTLGFRVTADGKSVVFLSDVEHPATGPTTDALALAHGADLLIHDAMYLDEEYRQRRGWGHSPVSSALRLAKLAEARKLALFHHNPDASDRAVDRLVERASEVSSVPLFAAAEGAYQEL